MFEKRNWKVFFLGLSFFLAFGVVAFGQATSDITGTVTDPSGAVIPGAKVAAINEGTNIPVNTVTNSSGLYRVPNLNVGSYTLRVEAKGFKTYEQKGIELNAGVVNRTDVTLQLGQSVQTVTVEAGAQLVSTQEAKLQDTVRGEQIQNLALNGRNVFDLIKLAPGAVNVQGVMFENGAGTVVNGVRESYNGFLLNGMPNKGLSGGYVNQPNQDTVAEFTVNTLNVSAQYGTSAGSVTNLVTKSGTNEFHGDVYEYLRNDALDATDFFSNMNGAKKPPLRYNQFGGSVGGPIIKDKTFFFASYQGDRTKTETVAPVVLESPDYENAVKTALPGSVAALLYSNYPTPAGAAAGGTISSYFYNSADPTGSEGLSYIPSIYGTTKVSAGLTPDPTGFLTLVCPDNLADYTGGTLAQVMPASNAFQKLFGVSAAEQGSCPTAIATNAAGLGNRTLPYQIGTSAAFPTETAGNGNLFHGTEWSVRIDHNMSDTNRLYGQFNYQHSQDKYGPGNFTSLRGVVNPQTIDAPQANFAWTHIFSPTIVNEARGAYLRSSNNIDVPKNQAGVPYVGFGTGEIGFGAYNGYPQFFQENIYSFSDMLSITRGKHAFKTGFNIDINQENSEFNVARPSYYFLDEVFFAADLPAEEAAGVDPGILTNTPAELATNNRAFRNKDWGAFFQDDWKVTSHLTLNLGIRYDYYSRHTEKFGRVTQFIYGPGSNVTSMVKNASTPAGDPGCDTAMQEAQAQIAGVCGPGGFATATELGKPDRNDFGPRFGFAYDPTGKGTMAVRGGFGVSYEGSFYNALSNSRWNLPYYSFNIADNFLFGDVSDIVYGPTVGTPGNLVSCTTAISPPAGCSAPTFTGNPTNPGQGIGAQAVGNLSGWDSANANLAYLTAIVDPLTFRDPYVYNWFLGVQKQLNRSTGIEVDYVGTAGHKLIRSANVNYAVGGRLPIPNTCASDYGSNTADPWACSNLSYSGTGRVNPNFGTLRVWENAVNSIYNGLQLSLTRRMSNGLALNANYTWSHSIDGGSDWHSGATSANGSAAGDAYQFDVSKPGLDRGNSTFDIRHRLVVNYVWQLPWYKSQVGFVGHVLGGWQTSGLWSFQTGAHWTAYSTRPRSLLCSGGTEDGSSTNSDTGATACISGGGTVINNPNLAVGGDWNLDGNANDRPSVKTSNTIAGTKDGYANGYFNGTSAAAAQFFAAPCLACNGNVGRNTFVGPSLFTADLAVFKNIKINERFSALFRADFFNAFNRANFLLPSSSTGANYANRIQSSNFGQSAGTFDPREIQFSLKLSF
jgi:hypothetical protein